MEQFKDLPVDHVGVAVASLEEALPFYRDVLGMTVDGVEEVAEQGVRLAFLRAGASHIELLEPLSPESSVGKFLAKRGPGLHHVALAVPDLAAALQELAARDVPLIDRQPRRGGGRKLIAFLHPRAAGGVLVELCQPLEMHP